MSGTLVSFGEFYLRFGDSRLIFDDTLSATALYWRQHFIGDSTLLATALYWRQHFIGGITLPNP
jgi:hypothetical protein